MNLFERQTLVWGGIGFIAFTFIANSVKADTTVQDHYKNIIYKKPSQVEVCYEGSGDKTGDTLLGAIIGGAIGLTSGVLAMQSNQVPGRQFGGSMDTGKTYLVGERGPELVTSGTKSTVTANQDLQSTFDTSALETKMASMINELNSANKTLNSMVNGVNTLVAVESRALKAVETTARKDRNQVGLV